MINDGFYAIEYYYKDTRGHVRTRKFMRGTFDLIVPVYKDLVRQVKQKDIHAPIKKPKFLKIKAGIENEISFKKEYEEWQSMKSNIKK